MDLDYTIRQIITTREKEEYRDLLERVGLVYTEYAVQIGAYYGEELVGGISLDKNCIKLLRVSCLHSGKGISNGLVGEVTKIAYDKGILHIFVYTKPENEEKFTSQGFYKIFKTDNVLFLENQRSGIKKYVNSLKSKKVEGKNIASIVMNLNPLTLGHEYLIKKACEENDVVHIFIVKEDLSVFPYEVRLKILKEVAKRYENLIVHEGSDYIISSATFPTYFIKSSDNIPEIYARLDVNIFGEYIVNTLGINKRYIGTEPYSKTTNMYNKVIKEVLSTYDVNIIEVDRTDIDNEVVSASKVREFIKNDKIENAYKLLPQETIDFLKSDEAKGIVEKIRVNDSRH
ncbi:MAG: [citrate (pro-3S)-lyase] ligase [Lachnospirales bacterium]